MVYIRPSEMLFVQGVVGLPFGIPEVSPLALWHKSEVAVYPS
jgi:hypothetical protein